MVERKFLRGVPRVESVYFFWNKKRNSARKTKTGIPGIVWSRSVVVCVLESSGVAPGTRHIDAGRECCVPGRRPSFLAFRA